MEVLTKKDNGSRGYTRLLQSNLDLQKLRKLKELELEKQKRLKGKIQINKSHSNRRLHYKMMSPELCSRNRVGPFIGSPFSFSYRQFKSMVKDEKLNKSRRKQIMVKSMIQKGDGVQIKKNKDKNSGFLLNSNSRDQGPLLKKSKPRQSILSHSQKIPLSKRYRKGSEHMNKDSKDASSRDMDSTGILNIYNSCNFNLGGQNNYNLKVSIPKNDNYIQKEYKLDESDNTLMNQPILESIIDLDEAHKKTKQHKRNKSDSFQCVRVIETPHLSLERKVDQVPSRQFFKRRGLSPFTDIQKMKYAIRIALKNIKEERGQGTEHLKRKKSVKIKKKVKILSKRWGSINCHKRELIINSHRHQ